MLNKYTLKTESLRISYHYFEHFNPFCWEKKCVCWGETWKLELLLSIVVMFWLNKSMNLNYHKMQQVAHPTLHQSPLCVCMTWLFFFVITIILQNMSACVGMCSSPRAIRGIWDTWLSRGGSLFANKNLVLPFHFNYSNSFKVEQPITWHWALYLRCFQPVWLHSNCQWGLDLGLLHLLLPVRHPSCPILARWWTQY